MTIANPAVPAPVAAPAAEPTPAPTPEPTPTPEPDAGIPNEYDSQGLQVVEDGVLDFDQPEVKKDETPLITPIDPQPGDEEPVVDPEKPAEPVKPIDPEKPVEDPEKPVDPAKPVEPVKPTEPVLLAGKYKTEQDLKDAFIELGGDPANFEDVKMLEQAYQVRQTEFSRSRAEIKAATPPPPLPKTYAEIVAEEYAKFDPTTFEQPADLWNAQAEANKNAAARFQEQQDANRPETISAEDMNKNMQSMTALNELKIKVPRLGKDKALQKSLGLHILALRDQGKMPLTEKGYEDPEAAFKDMIQGQSAIVEEAAKIFKETQEAKTLSTATNNDNAPPTPQNEPKKTAADSIVDDLLGSQAEKDRKYGNT